MLQKEFHWDWSWDNDCRFSFSPTEESFIAKTTDVRANMTYQIKDMPQINSRFHMGRLYFKLKNPVTLSEAKATIQKVEVYIANNTNELNSNTCLYSLTKKFNNDGRYVSGTIDEDFDGSFKASLSYNFSKSRIYFVFYDGNGNIVAYLWDNIGGTQYFQVFEESNDTSQNSMEPWMVITPDGLRQDFDYYSPKNIYSIHTDSCVIHAPFTNYLEVCIKQDKNFTGVRPVFSLTHKKEGSSYNLIKNGTLYEPNKIVNISNINYMIYTYNFPVEDELEDGALYINDTKVYTFGEEKKHPNRYITMWKLFHIQLSINNDDFSDDDFSITEKFKYGSNHENDSYYLKATLLPSEYTYLTGSSIEKYANNVLSDSIIDFGTIELTSSYQLVNSLSVLNNQNIELSSPLQISKVCEKENKFPTREISQSGDEYFILKTMSDNLNNLKIISDDNNSNFLHMIVLPQGINNFPEKLTRTENNLQYNLEDDFEGTITYEIHYNNSETYQQLEYDYFINSQEGTIPYPDINKGIVFQVYAIFFDSINNTTSTYPVKIEYDNNKYDTFFFHRCVLPIISKVILVNPKKETNNDYCTVEQLKYIITDNGLDRDKNGNFIKDNYLRTKLFNLIKDKYNNYNNYFKLNIINKDNNSVTIDLIDNTDVTPWINSILENETIVRNFSQQSLTIKQQQNGKYIYNVDKIFEEDYSTPTIVYGYHQIGINAIPESGEIIRIEGYSENGNIINNVITLSNICIVLDGRSWDSPQVKN